MGNYPLCKCCNRQPYSSNQPESPPPEPITQGPATNRSIARSDKMSEFAEKNRKMHESPLKPMEDLVAPTSRPHSRSKTDSGHKQKYEKSCDINESVPEDEEKPINQSSIMEMTPIKRGYNERLTEPTNAGSSIMVGATKSVQLSRGIRESAIKVSPAKTEKSRKSGHKIRPKRVIRLQKNLEPAKSYYKGILEKYHPGFSLLYVPRECKITKDYFEYYSVSSQHFKLPLVRLMLEDIESVSRVHVYLPESLNLDSKGNPRCQFEIIMNSSWSLQKSSLSTIRSSLKIANPQQTYSRNIMPRSHSFCPVQPETGHLMPKPALFSRYEKEMDSSFSQQKLSKIRELNKGAEKLWTLTNVIFTDYKEAQEYEQFLIQNEKRLSRISTNEKIETKNPKKWIQSLAGWNTWNNRELEWYLAESRMLFSANSEDDCNRWVMLLNWLLNRKK